MTATDPHDPQRFEVRMTSDSHFSWLRTRMSIERTLMAWVRTATGLIGFGFTIVQFFERFAGMEGVEAAARPNAPRYLGLALIGAGIVGLLIALWQYRGLTSYLAGAPFTPLAGIGRRAREPTVIVAIVVLLIGVFALFAVATRMA